MNIALSHYHFQIWIQFPNFLQHRIISQYNSNIRRFTGNSDFQAEASVFSTRKLLTPQREVVSKGHSDLKKYTFCLCLHMLSALTASEKLAEFHGTDEPLLKTWHWCQYESSICKSSRHSTIGLFDTNIWSWNTTVRSSVPCSTLQYPAVPCKAVLWFRSRFLLFSNLLSNGRPPLWSSG
jgi:hypothetical protein